MYLSVVVPVTMSFAVRQLDVLLDVCLVSGRMPNWYHSYKMAPSSVHLAYHTAVASAVMAIGPSEAAPWARPLMIAHATYVLYQIWNLAGWRSRDARMALISKLVLVAASIADYESFFTMIIK